jgi:hypothetical protein
MESNDRLDRMKKAIEEFTAAFYQRSDDAVKKFSSSMDDINNGIMELVLNKDKYGINETSLLKSLTLAMNAVQEKDFILAADIFKFDILPLAA